MSILDYGENADEVFFIRSGEVEMYTKGAQKIGVLPKYSWFGDWNVIHKLRSIITFVSSPQEGKKTTLLLCISKKKFKELLNAHPAEKRHFERFSLVRRHEILTAMDAIVK